MLWDGVGSSVSDGADPVWYDMARQAWRGGARLGEARPGKAWQARRKEVQRMAKAKGKGKGKRGGGC